MRKKSYIYSVNVRYVLSVAQASVCNGFVGYSTVNECKDSGFISENNIYSTTINEFN